MQVKLRTALARIFKSFLRYFDCGINSFRISDFQINEYLENIILHKATGVLHIGAHFAEKAQKYASKDFEVLWIETDPDLFLELQKHISKFPKQSAINSLIGEFDKEDVDFYVTNKLGFSSSTYRLINNQNRDFLKINHSLKLKQEKLDSVLSLDDVRNLDYWVLDVQGAELDVLKGAGDLIEFCKYLQVESTNYFLYEGQPLFAELCAFFESKNSYTTWYPPQEFHGEVMFLLKEGL